MGNFKKATKEQTTLKISLDGPSGSGKTYTALRIATGMVGDGGRILVLDTENRRARLYSDLFSFDVEELDIFSPQEIMRLLGLAAQDGYGAVIIDSLSHAWMGREGLLEQVDKISAESKNQNGISPWAKATPIQRAMIECIQRAPFHVIATLRVNTEWVMEKDDKGRTVPTKVGMKPVQREGIEYEFDISCSLDMDNVMRVTNTRVPFTRRLIVELPDEEFGRRLDEWCQIGSETNTHALIEQIDAIGVKVFGDAVWKTNHRVAAAQARSFGAVSNLEQLREDELLVLLDKMRGREEQFDKEQQSTEDQSSKGRTAK